MPSRRHRREFGRLFAGSARHLWIVASATAPRGLVDDVLQESALIGLRRFRSYERGTSFGAWMAQIVRNVALNQTRSAAKQRSSADVDVVLEGLAGADRARLDSTPAVTPGGELFPDQPHFGDRLEHALRSLPADARASFLLHTVDEVPHASIAELLGLPEVTVASHIHRARARLRETLRSEDPSNRRAREACDEASELAR